ncbi:hypothetical protein OH77DRAFT_1588711 [Trametes cingulata]|nr:hypothetical protein OH77DRAFT_1588711 [Trametes cingulata]
MPLIRCYPRPGGVEADPWPADYASQSREYSPKLKELCKRYASKPKPAAKGHCKDCNKHVKFVVRLCYAKYIAGAYRRICRACKAKVFLSQPGPKEDQLEEIEQQRDCDAVQVQIDRDARLATRLDRQERKAITKQEKADEKALQKQEKKEAAARYKQEKAEANAQMKNHGAVPRIVKAKVLAAKTPSVDREGPVKDALGECGNHGTFEHTFLGEREGNIAGQENDSAGESDREEPDDASDLANRDDVSVDSDSDDSDTDKMGLYDEPVFVTLVFWIKDGEPPLKMRVKVRDHIAYLLCYMSDYPEVLEHVKDAQFHLQYWAEDTVTSWDLLLWAADPFEVPMWASAILIRLPGVNVCQGFPQALRRLQFDQVAYDGEEEYAEEVERDTTAAIREREHSENHVWVVFWWECDRCPHAWQAAAFNRMLDLTMVDFEEPSVLHGHREVEVWMPHECSWRGFSTAERLRLGVTTHTILVRARRLASMPGLGVEMSALSAPAIDASARGWLAGDEDLKGASSSGTQKRARSESVEILDPNEPETQAIKLDALAKKPRRMAEREGPKQP